MLCANVIANLIGEDTYLIYNNLQFIHTKVSSYSCFRESEVHVVNKIKKLGSLFLTSECRQTPYFKI